MEVIPEAVVDIGQGFILLAKKSDKESELTSGWTYGAPKKVKKQRVRTNRPEAAKGL